MDTGFPKRSCSIISSRLPEVSGAAFCRPSP
jgi:hypothetical protein